jgi:fused signal recognition particle receptor
VTRKLAEGRYDKEIDAEEVKHLLAGIIADRLETVAKPLELDPAAKPHVILMVGVNGAGKTTTIGKLAQQYIADGKKVVLAAGDTFRAAAVEQLKVWGQRTGAEVMARDVGADAAGLAFDALARAKSESADVLMIDTAGRLQNRKELMDELAKIVRVLKKQDESAPHSVVLVLDASTGQNAISQAQVFTEIAGVTGIVMTKLDGTARGGILVALAAKFGLPIHAIGVGEGIEDLQPFSPADFARALVGADGTTDKGTME